MMAHGHASEAGTSVLKYLTPELVHDEEAVCTLELFEDKFPEFKQYIKFDKYTDTGTLGDAVKGTAEKGKIIVERSVDRIVMNLSKTIINKLRCKNEHNQYKSKKTGFCAD